MKHVNRKKIESLILLLDFRKVFDSLSHKYIDECLRMFNFRLSIRKLVSLFFCKLIKEITYAQKKSHSETFADDTSICIRRNPEYLRKCVEILKYFARIGGLQCNLERTSVFPIGGNYDINDKLCPE